jgi:hypothetical protein
VNARGDGFSKRHVGCAQAGLKRLATCEFTTVHSLPSLALIFDPLIALAVGYDDDGCADQ